MISHLGVKNDGRYRVLKRHQIIEGLLFHCWPYEVRFANRDQARSSAEQVLERWLQMGLPCSRQGETQRFDFCEVFNFMKFAAIVYGDPTYKECAVASGRRMATEFLASGDRNKTSGPRRFLVTWRREFNLESCPRRSSVRLRLPIPYESSSESKVSVKSVELECSERITINPGRLEVLAEVGQGDKVTIEVEISFVSRCQIAEVTPGKLERPDISNEEYELYTRPVEGRIQVSARIIQLADELVGASCNAWDAVGAFWQFCFEHLKSGYIHYDDLDSGDPLRWVVEEGWCDCLNGSALLVGLCRARGIPARIVGGLTLHAVMPAYHYWAEVLLPPHGWVPFDLLGWDLAAGNHRLKEWSDFYFGRLDYRMKAECLPRIAIGIPGVRFPRSWYMALALTTEGSETSYFSLEGNKLLYRDTIRVTVPESAVAK